MEKRFYLGLLILVLLLALGLGTGFGMKAIHRPIEDDLSRAADLAEGGQQEASLQLAQNAYVRWQRFHSLTASCADHNPMDDTDTLFQEMLVYGQMGELPHFVASCRELAVLVRAMYDAHNFSLKNVL